MPIEAGSKYTLIVKIPNAKDRKDLHKGEYNFCISKEVGDVHNVIWLATDDYGAEQTHTWIEKYQVYMVKDFEAGEHVQPASDIKDIKFGQTCTLEENKEIGPATGDPNDSGKFYIENKYRTANIGISSMINGSFAHIYVSRPIVKGSVTFEPMTIVHIWFGIKQTTGTMYIKAESNSDEYSDEANSNSLKVEYSENEKTITVVYKDGDWSRPKV